jgi:hypothetical protein
LLWRPSSRVRAGGCCAARQITDVRPPLSLPPGRHGHRRHLRGRVNRQYVDELLSGDRIEFVHAFYRTVCDAKRPVFVRSWYSTTKGVPLTANRLLLPLSEDGREVSTIAGAVTFEFTRPFALGADRPASYLEIVS